MPRLEDAKELLLRSSNSYELKTELSRKAISTDWSRFPTRSAHRPTRLRKRSRT